MNIIQRKITVDASISGTDFKGAVHIVDNQIERLEIEFHSKGVSKEIAIESEQQLRDLSTEINRILSYIDNEKDNSIADVDHVDDDLGVRI